MLNDRTISEAQHVLPSVSMRHPAARRRKLAAGPASLVTAASVFGISAYVFVSADHRAEALLLFGLPAPFDPSAPLGPHWLVDLSWDLTALGSVGVVASILGVTAGLLLSAGRWRPATYLLASVGSGVLFGYSLKKAFGLIRPHHGPTHGIETATSFPSGHALLASLLLFSLAFLATRWTEGLKRRRVRAFTFGAATLLSLGVGVSRVHLGFHWPTDVLAGWVAGAGWATLFWLTVARYGSVRPIEAEGGLLRASA